MSRGVQVIGASFSSYINFFQDLGFDHQVGFVHQKLSIAHHLAYSEESTMFSRCEPSARHRSEPIDVHNCVCPSVPWPSRCNSCEVLGLI